MDAGTWSSMSGEYTYRHNVFLADFPFKKSYFITTCYRFAVTSPLDSAIFNRDPQQKLNNHITITKFRSNIQNNKLCCGEGNISIKVGNIGTQVLMPLIILSCVLMPAVAQSV
jgi:hypothetical protein